MKKILLFLCFSVLACAFDVHADTAPSVVINEIAWMGTTHSANDEWMELKNTTATAIDLSGWSLKSADGKLKIALKGSIDAQGFYLMERTDDTSVPDIKADVIYTGALSNSGMDLLLYDNNGNVVDQVNASAKWPAGNNTTKQTMERTDSGGWQTSQNPGGTPRAENSDGSAVPSTATTPTTTTKTMYPSGAVINEILPNPVGADALYEWIELYNSSAISIDLSGWKLHDTLGITVTYAIPQSTSIPAHGFLIFKRPDTKIIMDNDSDDIHLLSPDGAEVDSVGYINAPLGESYNKTATGWVWSTTLTPGAPNVITQAKTTALPVAKKSDNNTSIESKTTATTIIQTVSPSQPTDPAPKPAGASNPWVLFYTALAVTAVVIGIAVFIHYRNPNNHVRT